MLRAGNSGDGLADPSGAAAAPVRQRLQGVEGRLEQRRQIQADQPEAAEEPRGTIKVKLAPNSNPPTSNVTLEQNEAS